jgi:prolyl-tRNA synthetase
MNTWPDTNLALSLLFTIKCLNMKTSQTIISTLRDAPADAVIASHQLMMRAGFIRKLANGLYTYMPLGLRSFRKVENIIREELDAAGFLEMKPTVVVPGDLWKESGRWQTMGEEMLKVKTRSGQDMVISPTAEEAFTAIIRDNLTSYKQLPIIGYQINTKYRDEIRPRYGVMRGREFVMMDAYSFDADEKSLDESYERFAKAYRRIFKRMGISAIPVRADTGAMGGSGSEEFMVESAVGDNTLILCPKCGYAANVEKAACRKDIALGTDGKPEVKTDKPVEKVSCPGVETIGQMEEFFKMPASQFIKVLIYKVYNSSINLAKAPGGTSFKQEKDESGSVYYPVSFFAVAIRGDLDVNETKLAAVLKASGAALAGEDEVITYSGAPHGFVGPVGLTKVPLLADESVMVLKDDGTYDVFVHDTVTGGGEKDVDNMHVEPVRDFIPFMTADIRTVRPGDKCPDCGTELYSKKGNELGHIFKLGDKYTKSMHVTYLDENGKSKVPLMGCYGIGLDRTLASIIEEHHDDKGIIWTMSTCPYQVAIVPIKYQDKMKEIADAVYEELTKAGIEVLLDDRNERPGVKFADMDLIGIPVRIVIGEKNLPNVEIKERSAASPVLVPAQEAAETAVKIVRDALAALDS